MSQSKKESVAMSSVFASAAMTLMKIVVGIMTGSMGILSEAAHSALDLGAAALTYFAVKIGDKPADDDHPFGHGKVESVSALIETGLLFLTSAWIIYEAVHRIIAKDLEVEITWYAFAVIIISIIIDISRSRALTKVAKETNSQALEADALHFSSDIWSSSVVLIGLVLVYFGVNGADAFAAIGVAIFVLVVGYRLGKRTIDVLIDTAPEGITDIAKEALSNVEGIIHIEKIRVRPLGPSVFIDVEIGINRSFSIIRVNEITQKAKEAVQNKIAGAEVLIHTKPVQLKNETLADIVRTVAAKHSHPVHSIIIDTLDGKTFINYDLELPRSLTVFDAHEVASHIEKEIKSEIGENIELFTHIDPIVGEETTSETISENEFLSLKKSVEKLTEQIAIISNPHNIFVRKIKGKIVISLHCHAENNETLENSHRSASELKSLIKETLPQVQNVIIHVEPKSEK